MENPRTPVRRVLTAILFTTGAAALITGVVVAVWFVGVAAGDPASSAGECALGVVLALVFYGPMLVLTGWKVTLPAVVIVGFGLAILQRWRRIPRWAEIVVAVYGGFVMLTALAI